MRRALSFILVLVAFAPALLAQPRFRNAGATLIDEAVSNKVVQAGELVTVGLALKNVGDAVASNLIASISGTGISNAAPQSHAYGILAPCAPSVSRDFTFTAYGESNSLLLVALALEDSGRALGTVTFRFRIGGLQTTVSANEQSVVIRPLGMAETYPSMITVTNAPGMVGGISVTLSNLSHSFPDDLDILLVSPGGDSVLLMSDTCGGVDLLDRTLTFSDDADQPLPDVGLPVGDSFKPTNFGPGDIFPVPAPTGPHAAVLSAFNGKPAHGDWKLFIVDDATGDGGALYDGWFLTLTTYQPLDSAPSLTFLGRTNDLIRFSVSGRPGRSYAIESSPDPVQAFPLETFIMPFTGIKTFEYPLESEDRFFRAVTDP